MIVDCYNLWDYKHHTLSVWTNIKLFTVKILLSLSKLSSNLLYDHSSWLVSLRPSGLRCIPFNHCIFSSVLAVLHSHMIFSSPSLLSCLYLHSELSRRPQSPFLKTVVGRHLNQGHFAVGRPSTWAMTWLCPNLAYQTKTRPPSSMPIRASESPSTGARAPTQTPGDTRGRELGALWDRNETEMRHWGIPASGKYLGMN